MIEILKGREIHQKLLLGTSHKYFTRGSQGSFKWDLWTKNIRIYICVDFCFTFTRVWWSVIRFAETFWTKISVWMDPLISSSYGKTGLMGNQSLGLECFSNTGWLKLHVKVKTKRKGPHDEVGESELTFRNSQPIFLPWTKVRNAYLYITILMQRFEPSMSIVLGRVGFTSTSNKRTKEHEIIKVELVAIDQIQLLPNIDFPYLFCCNLNLKNKDIDLIQLLMPIPYNDIHLIGIFVTHAFTVFVTLSSFSFFPFYLVLFHFFYPKWGICLSRLLMQMT